MYFGMQIDLNLIRRSIPPLIFVSSAVSWLLWHTFMGQGTSRGTGAALASEALRAEISVKLSLATGQSKVNQRQLLEEAFRASDADGDGSVDYAEFCSTASAIGLGVNDRELRYAFSRFDRNGDQAVEFSE